MQEQNKINENEAWKKGLSNWNQPSIPQVIAPRNEEELARLGQIAQELGRELAFMKYPEFQTYMNLEKIAGTFQENPQRGTQAIAEHEIGHRFCPYDVVTSIIMLHRAKKGLEGKKLPCDIKEASGLMLNLYADMNINTNRVRMGDEDLPWAYQVLSRDKKDSKLWRVYGRSMEIAWKREILPKDTKLSEAESEATKNIAGLFERDFFSRDKWPDQIQKYAEIMGDFLEAEKKDGKGNSKGEGKGQGNQEGSMSGGIDNISGNIPKELDDKTAAELAKRLARVGSDGLPSDPQGLGEFKDIMAGFGQGNPKQASINFYEMLSRSYDVMFATKPFGRPRQNPFQPVKWHPSMSVGELDIDYSVSQGGKIIPGITTYKWNSRKREIHGGLEEVVPNLDLYLDSSLSIPNPIDQISLLVLAGFVAAKKAQRKGAKVRSTNFSGQGQSSTQEWTRELQPIYENLVTYYGGGTVLPTAKMLEDGDPKQVVIITDTFLGNEEETANAIRELRKRNSGNRVTIYALNPIVKADYLREAGAEVIHGTTPEIFKRTIGKASEVYKQ
jgi:hypothetical protein